MSKTATSSVRPAEARLPVRNGLVVVGELAVFLGVDRSNLRKNLLKAGYKLDRMPFPQVGNQRVLTLAEEDARRFIATANANPLSGGGVVSYLDEG